MPASRACDQCGKPLPPEGRFCSHCGSLSGSAGARESAGAARTGPWERILERLRTVTADRYDVQRLLGWGGMAGVYLAEELRLKRRVAIKVIAPGLLMDPSQIERFEQEARTTAQLNHPNIVTIYEVDEREDLHYFTMTYVPGRALSQVMAEAAAPLPVPVVQAWLRQVAGALSYAHQRGVVHRDIKPGNILLDEHGNALVGDFGIAKVAEEPGLTRTGMLVGTPAYMSPEQCTTGKVAGASDQYSLGAVAYQLLCGQPPFSGSTIQVIQAHVSEPPRDVRELRPECPEELAVVVMRMLAKDPADRWPSLYDAVDAVGGGALRHDDPVRAVMARLSAWTHAVRIDPPDALDGDAGRSTLGPGEEHAFGAVALDYRGEALPDRAVEWSAKPDGVVEVAPDGRVRAVGPGRATVVVTSGRVKTEWTFKVGASTTTGPITPAEGVLAAGAPTMGDPSPTPGPPPPVEAAPGPGVPTPPATAPPGPDVPEPSVPEPSDSPPSRETPVPAGASFVEDSPSATAPPSIPEIPAPAEPAPAPAEGTSTGAPAPPPSTPAPSPDSPDGVGSRVPLLAGLGVAVVAAVAVAVAVTGGGNGDAAPGPSPLTAVDSETVAGPAAPPSDSAVTEVDSPTSPATLRMPGALPDGARLTIRGPDGERIVAPGDLELEPGDYDLELTATGYRAATTTVSVAAGESVEWAPDLVEIDDGPEDPPPPPPPGRVRIGGSLPDGAVVRVRGNGVDRAVTGSVELPPGAYTFEASAPGYESARTSLTVISGQAREWAPRMALVPQERPTPSDPEPPPADTPVVESADDEPEEAAESPEARAAGIVGALETFASALESRDAARLRAAWPSVGDNWIQFIGSSAIRDLRVRASDATVPPEGDRVDVLFTLTLDYESGAPAPGAQPYRATVERRDAGWVLVDLRGAGGN